MSAPIETLPPPLTRQELDVAQCMICGGKECKHDPVLTLQQRCHRQAPVYAEYDRSTGILTLRCVVCRRMTARIKIATSDREGLN